MYAAALALIFALLSFQNCGGSLQSYKTESVSGLAQDPGGNFSSNSSLRSPSIDLSKAKWSAVSLNGAPTETFCPTAVWTGSRVLVIGGATSGMPVYSYDPETDSWEKMQSKYNGTAGYGTYDRRGTTSTYYNGRVVQNGGYHTVGACSPAFGCYYSETFTYNPQTGDWLDGVGWPNNKCRWGHTAVLSANEILLAGGANPAGAFAETFSHNLDSGAFTSRASMPQARNFAVAAMIDETTMWVWGGSDVAEHAERVSTAATGYATSLFYNKGTNQWTPGLDVSPLSARESAAFAFTGNQVAIFGGRLNGDYFADGAVFEPAANQWKMLPSLGAPSPRECAASVWTGKGFFVWGGVKDGVQVRSGAILK